MSRSGGFKPFRRRNRAKPGALLVGWVTRLDPGSTGSDKHVHTLVPYPSTIGMDLPRVRAEGSTSGNGDYSTNRWLNLERFQLSSMDTHIAIEPSKLMLL
jgi:hypothetical protein